MCLSNPDMEKTKVLQNFRDPIIVYKWLIRNSSGLMSPYMPYRWEVGELVKSNRPSRKITNFEFEFRKVQKGFHFYTNKNDAVDEAAQYNRRQSIHAAFDNFHNDYQTAVVGVYQVPPRDVVAVGTFDRSPSLVAMSARLLSVEEVTPNLRDDAKVHINQSKGAA